MRSPPCVVPCLWTTAGPHRVYGQQAHSARDSIGDVTQAFEQTVADQGTWLLFAHAAATLYMTGVIWFVQIVHYPLFSRVGQPGFSDYEREHVRRTGWVVAGPMLVELAAAVAVVWVVGDWLAWTGLALVGIIWCSTGLWQVPAHLRLEAGFDEAVHLRLTRTNWVRTAAWTARSVVALGLAATAG